MQRILQVIVILSFLLCFSSCKKTKSEGHNPLINQHIMQQEVEPGNQEASYKLVWVDEFDVSGSPDTTKWGYDIGGNGWGNNEVQYYTRGNRNVRVNDGSLIIEAHKDVYNGIKYYTSGRLITKHKAEWTYGKFEIKAKIPKGVGTWPTIWLLSANEPLNWPQDGELDIMEAVGFNANLINGVAHNFLYNGANGLYKGGNVLIPGADESFHIYSIEWTDKKITWFVDGNLYFSYSDPGLGSAGWPYNANFYMILNIAIGGNYGGQKGIDDSIFPQQMLIDYVRVYQKKV